MGNAVRKLMFKSEIIRQSLCKKMYSFYRYSLKNHFDAPLLIISETILRLFFRLAQNPTTI